MSLLLKCLLSVVLVMLISGLIASATDVNSPQAASEATAAASADVTGPLSFVGITPCRIVETRGGQGFSDQAGPPALIANQQRTFQVTGTVSGLPRQCGIPSTAVAISVNFTVTGFSSGGDLRIYPAGSAVPLASIINFQQENVANATNMPLGMIPGKTEKGFTVQADGASTQFIADVNGYFASRHFTQLESGQTLKGAYGLLYRADAANDTHSIYIQFPVPIVGSMHGNYMRTGETSSQCPGSWAYPSAAKGELCFYESASNNVYYRSFWGFEGLDTGYLGAAVYVQPTDVGLALVRGTWAATAP